MNILIYSVSQIENFGGPSLVNGLDEILAVVFPNSKAVCLDHLIQNKMDIEDNKIIRLVIPNKIPGKYKFILNALSYRLFKKTFFAPCDVFEKLEESDMLVNATGIQFCDNFVNVKPNIIKSFIPSISLIDIGAKILGKKLVSYTKSYGPIHHMRTRRSLKLHGKYFYDLLLCREKLSQRVLTDNGIKPQKTFATYDSGFMMKSKEFNVESISKEKYVIFSISFQIIRQWKDNDINYIQLMQELIKHILAQYKYNIIILPNEFKNAYDDMAVAKDIKKEFENNDRVKIFDIRSVSPKNVKYLISKSEILIGSRYHSIIASLSSSVPTLVIGWHYKYEEVVNKFKLDEYLIKIKDCTPQLLIEKFGNMEAKKTEIKNSVAQINIEVKNNIIQTGLQLKKLVE